VLNFAHGEFIVFGALLATSAVDRYQAPLIIAVLAGVAGAAALWFPLERSVLRPISARPLFVQFLVAACRARTACLTEAQCAQP